jgi:hypothetical protein
VVLPAAVSSGHGVEALGVGVGTLLIWFVIRVIWGKDEADDFLEQEKDRHKSQKASKR